MWSDAPLLIFKGSPAPKLITLESLVMCASVFGLFSCLSAVVQNCTLLPIWFSLKYKLGQCEYLHNSIAVRAFLSAHKTISLWVSTAALWKSMQLLGQHHSIMLPVPQFPGFALFLGLDSSPKPLVFVYITTGWLSYFWVEFFLPFLCKCLVLENWQQQ